ncbi:helix-turn-helix domain-containing protein [uncultured Metabacillus sp.]|uniref:helix-turn-helix domain-containing protein n=1 Tax=uncultured Metabacillus sp. TaxID=2860135 RepID=UPI002607F9AB|nr:helix-turn-helix domain-containing protein [uncultured Metabacillus sp.]
MLVSEIIHKIMMKEMTIKELAELYGVSNRTIQLKIKKLGYEWDSKQSIYNYVGETPEPSDLDFSTLFGRNAIWPSTSVPVTRGKVDIAQAPLAT